MQLQFFHMALIFLFKIFSSQNKRTRFLLMKTRSIEFLEIYFISMLSADSRPSLPLDISKLTF